MIRRLGFVATALALATASAGGTAVAVQDTGSQDSPLTTAAPGKLSVLDVAHRGAAGYAPENTLAAIDEADDRGATTVEIDVQRSKDGELVVIHDTTLERTTDAEEVFPDKGSYDVGKFTLKELRRLDAGSWYGKEYKGERIPTLGEALDRLRANGLNLLLEIKSPALYPGIESDIAGVVARNPGWLAPSGKRGADRLIIQSFDWESAERSAKLLPSVPHGLLGTVPEDEIADYAEWADQINPSHTKLTADYVQAVHDAGLEVLTYTVNDRSDMRAALDKGVDGIISDYPDVAREVIQEHAK
ncbi:glycerophosphodiester phosphodiesterase [Nocardiopsis composta]|uniref:Glycerophosphoryl diester phosphodiesterase n=1 Tax=Nocardiopsis composta TaxID=157465 RepID=A0A7W8VDA4_9ACTN|nr:glycerophosphodiester phosphodiesterase family protein [Nocardiopsis composta]MBB5432296.1 glycerophosphoryl diester phosphodiesterase [Nocardiopsis composta]